MDNDLEKFEKIKTIKELGELLDEIERLDYVYKVGDYEEMQKYINFIVNKYSKETAIWNGIFISQPQTHSQSYANARNFLTAKITSIILSEVFKSRRY